MSSVMKGILLEELDRWTPKYEFSFQLGGEGDNNVWIYKGGIELTSIGGRNTIEELFSDTLDYIYRINRTPKDKRVFGVNPYF